MRKYIKNIFIILILLLSFNCHDNPTSPPTDNVQPGRRDYVWKVDTLNYPYDPYTRIWGSSPTDIWLTSPGDWDKSISHYDGKKWRSYGINGMLIPDAIFGFSSNYLLIGAINGQIWRYDGNNWNKTDELTQEGHNDIVFENMWGESTNDLYAFGAYPDTIGLYNNSVVVHYINNHWKNLDTKSLHGVVENLFKNSIDNKIYLKTLEWNNGTTSDSIFIYSYDNNVFKRVYSGTWDYIDAGNISLINGEVYFVLGRKIARRINNSFSTILDLSDTYFNNIIWGRSSRDIFLSMIDGLAHYNGSDVEYLLHFKKPKTNIFGAILFDKDVFFLVYEGSTNLNLIYHGKLK